MYYFHRLVTQILINSALLDLDGHVVKAAFICGLLDMMTQIMIGMWGGGRVL
jgi:hypothetical protein